MIKRRFRNSARLKLTTSLTWRIVAGTSVFAIIIVAIFFGYSNFFSPFTSEAENTLTQGLGGSFIRLVYFRATSGENGTVLIEWSSYSEIDNDFYSIDRSADGLNFSVVALVEGSPTSTTQRLYSYVDTQPLEGANYYRLRQTDYRGWTELNSIIPLVIVNENPMVVQVKVNEQQQRDNQFEVVTN